MVDVALADPALYPRDIGPAAAFSLFLDRGEEYNTHTKGHMNIKGSIEERNWYLCMVIFYLY